MSYEPILQIVAFLAGPLGLIWAFIQVVLLFAVVIMVHEMGHFLFAKLFGVKVESFNIGFGRKRLWQKRIGETDYTIRPWPLGGFVQLHGHFRPEELEQLEGKKKDAKQKDGEADQPDESTDDESKRGLSEMAYDDIHALREKPAIVKLIVFGAGVGFNYLSVVLVFAVLFMVGFEIAVAPIAKLDVVEPSSPLYAAGLRSNDLIVSVNCRPVDEWEDLLMAVREGRFDPAGAETTLIVAREGETTYSLSLSGKAAHEDAFLEIMPWLAATVGAVVPGHPAEAAGLNKGDTVVAIDGRPVRSWSEMARLIHAKPDEQITLTIQRMGGALDVDVVPRATTGPEGKVIGLIGIGTEVQLVRTLNPFKAVAGGFSEASSQLVEQAVLLGRMFGRKNVSEMRESLGGPVAIIDWGRRSAQAGFGQLLRFFCMLSLALVIFNLLPIPLLDGGHILQVLVEAVIRRRIPMKALLVFYNAALIFLLAFVLLVSANDFLRIGKRWFPGSESPVQTQTVAPDGATTGSVEFEPTPAQEAPAR